MFKLIFFTVLVTISLHSFSQQFHTGYAYVLNEDKFYPITYLREYSREDSSFTTTYSIYNMKGSFLFYSVILMHRKYDKMVFVDVMNSSISNYPVNEEEVQYENPSLIPFGLNRSVRGLGGSRVPEDLKVKFVNDKFEYLKVLCVNGTQRGTTDYILFVLDDDPKISLKNYLNNPKSTGDYKKDMDDRVRKYMRGN